MPYCEWLAQSCLMIILAKQMACQHFWVQVMCKGQSYLHDDQLGIPFDPDVLHTASQGCLQALYETSVLSKVVGLAPQVLTDGCKLHARMCHQPHMLSPVCNITRTRPRENVQLHPLQALKQCGLCSLTCVRHLRVQILQMSTPLPLWLHYTARLLRLMDQDCPSPLHQIPEQQDMSSLAGGWSAEDLHPLYSGSARTPGSQQGDAISTWRHQFHTGAEQAEAEAYHGV